MKVYHGVIVNIKMSLIFYMNKRNTSNFINEVFVYLPKMKKTIDKTHVYQIEGTWSMVSIKVIDCCPKIRKKSCRN